jgi:hypothetical protein
MTKKPKKAKTPKAPKGRGGRGGGKDPVTGLYWEVDGIGRLTNDKPGSITYEQAQRAIRPFIDAGYEDDTSSAAAYPMQIEVELSSNRMVITSIDSQGNIGRDVVSGVLSFTKGRLSGMRVNEIANYYISRDGSFESGIVESFSGGRAINNPSNYYSVHLDMGGSGQIISDYYFSLNQSIGEKSTFTSYAGGRFFYDGWQNNPFASNLI